MEENLELAIEIPVNHRNTGNIFDKHSSFLPHQNVSAMTDVNCSFCNCQKEFHLS